MASLSSTSRIQNLTTLANTRFDVLVIGGGVTGAGVALDAAARGYSVALVEKSDFASGTSSKSTKLVHGGIRYLPNFDFALVHEALTERGLLLQNAPFLVAPVPFVLPIYKGDRHPVGMPFTTPGGIGLSQLLNLGLWFYDTMAGGHDGMRHRHISREEVLKHMPTLVTSDLKEGFIYYDAQTNDARLTLALLRTAASQGAVIANYAAVTGFSKKNGVLQGAIIKDTLSQQEFTVQARHIVNATGVYSEQVEELATVAPQVQVTPSKGVHLVFPREKLQLTDSAVVLPETDDQRILFIVPWQSRVIFGTTDTGEGDLDAPKANNDDISYLMKHLNRYLSTHLTEDDIISSYAGYRPLVQSRSSKHSNARLSRTHTVLESSSGLVSIVGGKLTTYRRMAKDTVDLLSRRDGSKLTDVTRSLPLEGAVDWANKKRELVRRGRDMRVGSEVGIVGGIESVSGIESRPLDSSGVSLNEGGQGGGGLDSEVIEHLGWSYGSQALVILDMIEEEPTLAQRLVADLPYIQAEVVYACRYEMAMKPEDVIARRTSLVLEDWRHGGGAEAVIQELMERAMQRA